MLNFREVKFIPLSLFILCYLSPIHTSYALTDHLKIASIFPRTGSQAKYGEDARAGIQLALDYIKKTDPMIAKNITIINYDDHSTPSGALAAAKQALKDQASIMIGSITPMNTRVLGEISKKHEIPLIVPSISSLNSGLSHPYIFRSCYLDQWQGKILARFAFGHLKKMKAALLYDPNDAYSHDLVEHFKQSWNEFGGVIVSKVLYHSEQKKIKLLKHIRSIQSAHPDFIVFPSKNINEIATAMTSLSRLGSKIPLLGSDRWHTKKLPKLAKHAYSGHYYSLPFTSLDPDERARDFSSRFKIRVKRVPSKLAAHSHDALLLAVHSFKKAGTRSKKQIFKKLAKTKDMPALSGFLSMNEHHFSEKPSLIMGTTLTGAEIKFKIVNQDPVIQQAVVPNMLETES